MRFRQSARAASVLELGIFCQRPDLFAKWAWTGKLGQSLWVR